METTELIRFIEEPEELNELDMNTIRGGINPPSCCMYGGTVNEK